MSQDLTELIERLEAFEDRLGVKLNGLYANLEGYDDFAILTVNGELYSESGADLKNDIELVISAYDSAGRVIGTTMDFVMRDSFFGLETFSSPIQVPKTAIARIRIYPKPFS